MSPESDSELGLQGKPWRLGRIPIQLQLRSIFLRSWFNLLLVFIPAGFAVNYTDQSPAIVFCVNFLALISLSMMLGWATEELSTKIGNKAGALLSITLGYVSIRYTAIDYQAHGAEKDSVMPPNLSYQYFCSRVDRSLCLEGHCWDIFCLACSSKQD